MDGRLDFHHAKIYWTYQSNIVLEHSLYITLYYNVAFTLLSSNAYLMGGILFIKLPAEVEMFVSYCKGRHMVR